MSSRAREARERLGLAAILSLDHAAELLPLDRAEARDWMRARGLVRQLNGRDVVRWGDVYDALQTERAAPVVPGLRRVPV